ncbi:MAG TPA: amidohydrolase/deacetylase family metallohydrolase, partial [Chloroflexota bacterium]|nr:amidohydrolase/deacetylase family metallohydrolase [Chloroflexota bacterium]
MRFDLLIKGGEVVDPGAGYSGRLDVAITRDRIAAVDRDIPAESAFTVVDAGGQLVTPGLVDLHTHCFPHATYWGIDPNTVAPSTGVTTWVDAGSAGAMNLLGFREYVVKRAEVRVHSLLNISQIGLTGPNHELAVLELCDVEQFERLANLNRDLVLGVKARMGTPTVGPHGVEPLRRALAAAERCAFPLMVHIGAAPPAIAEVLALLRPGDLLTHAFTGHTMRLVDEHGQPWDFVRAALDSGVLLDVGHGAGGFAWASAEAMLGAGYPPAVISTDVHQLSIMGPMFDLPTCMSKFLALGMSLPDVVRAATSRPAEILGLRGEVGTLAPGAAADVALFTLYQGRFPFYDTRRQRRDGDRLLRNTLTIAGGRPLQPRPPDPPAPWIEPSAFQRQLVELGHTPQAMAAQASPVAP